MGHGEFGSWKGKHFGDAKSRTVNRYMDLAAKFCRSSKLLLPEIVAANQLSLDLQAKGSTGKAFMGKLDKFVGNSGLTELMQKHGVIQRGGHRPQPQPETNTIETTGAEEHGQAEAAVFGVAIKAVETAERALMNDVLWHDLTPEAAKAVDAKLRALQVRFHERVLKHLHEAGE